MPLKDKEKRKEYNKNYLQKNRDELLKYQKDYREEHKEELSIYKKTYTALHKIERNNYISNNKESINLTRRQHYLKNREKLLRKVKEWYKNNKEKVKKYKETQKNHRNKLLRQKSKIDINFRVSNNLRNRVRAALKGKPKIITTINLVGCSIDFLKKHLELQFKEGMLWKNYGRGGWEIDHIKPCASFDLSKPEEQRKCFHYSNLQPLWAEENNKKRDKYAPSSF